MIWIISIDEELGRIKTDVTAVLREDCNDLDSIDFIKHKATLLKARINALKGKIGLEIDENKEFKMAYQKLYGALLHIQASIKFKMLLNPTCDDIKRQTELIKAAQNAIENLQQ